VLDEFINSLTISRGKTKTALTYLGCLIGITRNFGFFLILVFFSFFTKNHCNILSTKSPVDNSQGGGVVFGKANPRRFKHSKRMLNFGDFATYCKYPKFFCPF
jgi:hypothetical protein